MNGKMRKNKRKWLVGIVGAALLASPVLGQSANANSSSKLYGFTDTKSKWQTQIESALMGSVKESSLQYYSEGLAKRPALAGSAGNEEALKFAVDQLRKAGLKPQVKTYDTYLSSPKSISVTQTAPIKKELKVIEDLDPQTPYINDVIPGFNAYSPSGTVEGEVVYANYGTPEDFEKLKELGISLKDKIVLTRYGKNFRGVKPDLAAQYGAAGVLIYSDPADYVRGDVYPKGPWLPSDGIQRGSILSIYKYPGDPLTPGEPAIKGVKRIDPAKAASLPKIPTTPISYGEAKEILKTMTGQEAPAAWQGGLDFTYHLGSENTKVKLSLDIEYGQKPVNDVIVTIPGSKYPKEKIVIGAHRDTWAYGASDNVSGWAATMEIAKSLAELSKKGWQPERTIVLAGWDGEEHGLIGSTEWVEEERKDLTENAVAYINLDGVAGQNFSASAVPSLNQLMYDITKAVPKPGTDGSVFDHWVSRSGTDKPRLGQLGSGSDYTAFIQHIGVPSIGFGFSSPNGLNHSAYDNLDALQRFDDPGYKHQTAAAEMAGIMALRLANAEALPFKYSDYADNVLALIQEIKKNDTFGVDLRRFEENTLKWRNAALSLEQASAKILADNKVTKTEEKQLKEINRALLQQERDFINKKGLASREWFKHQIWAPGLTTGYAALPLPALAEAQMAGDKNAFKKAVKNLEKALQEAAKTADKAIK
ncbi:M28 family peptidase [Neobacillus mesonae]|uniref:M28 family peptidase n=1 Tax=Neobacillus mesonae TaxID=1193713 RepID=UPI00129026D1|nr:M28 family peptidase [Neobacillus mesonae]